MSADPPVLVEILRKTETFFRSKGVPTPRRDAELVLAHALGINRLQIYLQHDRPLTPAELERLRGLVQRRGRREPLAWIIEEQGFHAIQLQVLPGVLVPRPDTETLVEAALQWMPADAPMYLADVGCGSGAVGLAIASARPLANLYAIDLADAALACTRANVAQLGLSSRVAVLAGDLLAPIPAHRPLDWVVSNPPYLRRDEIAGLEPEVSRWEPKLALDGGDDGLEVVRRLAQATWRRGAQGLLLEIGAGQAGQTAEILHRAGWVDITTWPDLAGIARVVGGRRPDAANGA